MKRQVTIQDIYDLLQESIRITSEGFSRLEKRMDEFEEARLQRERIRTPKLTKEEIDFRLEAVEAIARRLQLKYDA